MHNIDENEVLRDALSGLNEDVPPMPEELHAAWMQKVEEDHMEKKLNRRGITRFLSIAAALVFVVGGTLLTRDDMEQRARSDAYTALQEANGYYAPVDSYADEYSAKLADYEAYDSGAAFGALANSSVSYTLTSSTAARGADMDFVTEEAAAPLAEPAETAKKIIRTADLTIKTQTFAESLENLRALCLAQGGWIESSSEYQNSYSGLRTAHVTLRIPQDALDGYLTEAEELGRVTSRSESATDVTASYQDTQTRLETQLALMERLQALITESGDLSDLLALESQIADTQYQIDSLQSSLNRTDRQVTYSTVSVTLQEEKAPELTDATVSLGDRIAAAIRMGFEALTDFAQDMLVFIMAALPFIAIVAVAAITIGIIRKIRRRNK